MSMRAALYARVSDPKQADGFSIDTQREAMRRYAAAQGFTVAYEFVEPHMATNTSGLSWTRSGPLPGRARSTL